MYVPDGNESLLLIQDPEGQEFRVMVDDETYAGLLNEGWTVVREEAYTRPPAPDHMFLAEWLERTRP